MLLSLLPSIYPACYPVYYPACYLVYKYAYYSPCYQHVNMHDMRCKLPSTSILSSMLPSIRMVPSMVPYILTRRKLSKLPSSIISMLPSMIPSIFNQQHYAQSVLQLKFSLLPEQLKFSLWVSPWTYECESALFPPAAASKVRKASFLYVHKIIKIGYFFWVSLVFRR